MTHSSHIISPATYTNSGWGERVYLCPSCSHSFVESYTIAQLTYHDDSSSGSWGGGDSGGGGGGSSADGGGGGGSSW